MTTRRGLALVLAGGLVVAVAGPASGHAELENGQARTNSVAELTLNVPVERDDGRNQRVVVELPAGFSGESCVALAGWSCSVVPPEDGAEWRVVWERLAPGGDRGGPPGDDRGGPPGDDRGAHPGDDRGAHPGDDRGGPPGDDDVQPAHEHGEDSPSRLPAGESMFRFSVHTPNQPRDYPLPVEQGYSTGETVRWDGPADSPNPAPVLTVS